MTSNDPYGAPYTSAGPAGAYGGPDYVPPYAPPTTPIATPAPVYPTEGAVPAFSGSYQDDQPSTAEVAKSQASDVAGTATDAAKNVAGTAKDQAAQVAGEAGRQAKELWAQAQSELSDQAQTQQQRLAGGLHSLGDQLHAMAEGSNSPGMATDFARQGADRAHQVAEWFENRDPGSVLSEVRSFARQRPGMFLALAVGAGLVAGRLARNLAADPDELAAQANDGSVRVQDGRHGAAGAYSAELGYQSPVALETGAVYGGSPRAGLGGAGQAPQVGSEWGSRQ